MADAKEAVLAAEAAIRELASQMALTSERGKLLAEARASLDAARERLAQAAAALASHESQLERVADTAAERLRSGTADFIAELTSAVSMAKADIREASLEVARSVESREVSAREAMQRVVADAQRTLLDSAGTVRDAELSFGSGAELLKSYSDAYRAGWVRSTEALLARMETALAEGTKGLDLLRGDIASVVQPAMQALGDASAATREGADAITTLGRKLHRPDNYQALEAKLTGLMGRERLFLVLTTLQLLAIVGLGIIVLRRH